MAGISGVSDTHWPLFERLPALAPVLDPVMLAALPTPVAMLDFPGANAWIKRDDLTHPEYGGNKIRKLEFVLGEIRRRGADEVITLGATGTNAGVAVGMVCAQERLPCTVITFPQAASPTVEKNRHWMQHYGVRFDACPTLAAAARRFYLHPHRLRRRSYFLFAGCSTPVSTFAYANAILELQQQIRAGQCPEPALIVVPVSSASTVAGLQLGIALAGLGSRVLGVRVAAERLGPFAVCTPGVVNGMVQRAVGTIHHHCGETLVVPPLRLDGSQIGGGYGLPTAASDEAMRQFARHGLALESTYSGKAAAAFLAALHQEPGPVLFWHTYNSRPPPGQLL